MHEHALILDLIKKIESTAKEMNADRVTNIRFRLGALSHTSPEHFRKHFEPVSAGTVAENATLEFTVSTDTGDPYASDIILESIDIEEK